MKDGGSRGEKAGFDSWKIGSMRRKGNAPNREGKVLEELDTSLHRSKMILGKDKPSSTKL